MTFGLVGWEVMGLVYIVAGVGSVRVDVVTY